MDAPASGFIYVGTREELEAQGRIVVRGRHRPILVVHDRGRVFALDNRSDEEIELTELWEDERTSQTFTVLADRAGRPFFCSRRRRAVSWTPEPRPTMSCVKSRGSASVTGIDGGLV